MRFLVDTNLLVHLVNGNRDPRSVETVKALEQLRQAGHLPAVVPQNFYEFWAVATRPGDKNGLGLSTQEAMESLNEFQSGELFQVLHDRRDLLSIWQSLVVDYEVSGKVTHDARLVAAMQLHGITHLLTFNAADFQRFAFITVVTPQRVIAGEVF